MTYFLLSESCVQPKAPVWVFLQIDAYHLLGVWATSRLSEASGPRLDLHTLFVRDGSGEPTSAVVLVALRRLSVQPVDFFLPLLGASLF